MEDIAVSVIIPVYGVEKYIRQCLESVINQTLKDIEIIVVNDGTKDNSMKIVEEYLYDKRIKIINKENGGLSSARNAGLKIAKGKYIAFIDSDDWVDSNMLKELFECNMIEGENEWDIISSEMMLYDNNTSKTKKRIIENDNILQGKGSLLYKLCGMEVCNKIYKRDFLIKNSLEFKEGIIHEDNLFTIKAFFIANKVKYINKYHYFYRLKRENSILNTLVLEKRKESFETILKEIAEFEKEFQGADFDKIRLMLAKLEQKSLLYRVMFNKKEVISKKEINQVENKLKEKWGKFSIQEKYVLKKDMIDLLESRAYYKLNIFNKFYWQNKFITKKGLRRIIKMKIKNFYNIK